MERHNRLCFLPEELMNLVWGFEIKPKLFFRWSQGFVFSEDEVSALIQTSGGPCAVIAPVQAFLLKSLIEIYQFQQLRELSPSTVDDHLVLVLSEILSQCQKEQSDAPISGSGPSSADISPLQGEASSLSSPMENEARRFQLACLDDPLPTHSASVPSDSQEISPADIQRFHCCVRLRSFDSQYDLEAFLKPNLLKYKLDFGILLFLYSVILTRGIARVREEMGDSEQSLIDSIEGHGGQALINLLICGRAAGHVWDGDKDVGGIKLSGIVRRPSVGFLTKMESLHYVQVGWYLKNPSSPVWVLASETHLTVLFSWHKKLVTPDTELERAKRVLSSFDSEGNKFIQREQLRDVLERLNLCAEDDFVTFMCKELDPENVGVILFHTFLDSFYDDDTHLSPDTFKVYHYNGMESSCANNKLQYAEGVATRQETLVNYSNTTSDILLCMNTKWDQLDIQWSNFLPTLN